jgi:DNA repair exonuclease SbcCD ATPase subunit
VNTVQDFIEAARRAATQAAERATWEANRLRRAGARQHDVDLSQRERSALLEQMAGVVLDLERRGQLTQEPLLALSRRLRALDEEIARGHAEVQTIRGETFKPGAGSASPAQPPVKVSSVAAEHPCPTCGQPVRDTAAYCSACGTRLR